MPLSWTPPDDALPLTPSESTGTGSRSSPVSTTALADSLVDCSGLRWTEVAKIHSRTRALQPDQTHILTQHRVDAFPRASPDLVVYRRKAAAPAATVADRIDDIRQCIGARPDLANVVAIVLADEQSHLQSCIDRILNANSGTGTTNNSMLPDRIAVHIANLWGQPCSGR